MAPVTGRQVRIHLRALFATEHDPAFLGMVNAVDHVQHRALAGAVGANDRPYFMLADIEGNIAQRLDAPKTQRNVLQVENDVADLLAHVQAAFFTTGKVFTSMIFRSAETLPRRPSSNLTSVSMNWLLLPP